MEFILNEVLPKVAKSGLADRVDIYIEKGFYDPSLASKYFDKAKELHLPICAHVEQLSEFGGVDLALKYDPQSVDHVVYASDSSIKKLAQSNTVAVLLPTSDFYLKMRYPPARKMIDSGVCVALACDFNPGTSPTQNLSFVGTLARLEMQMTLAEAIGAYTVGASRALRLDQQVGSFDLGKSCDFIALDDHWKTLFYSVGESPVARIFKDSFELFHK